MGWIKMRLYNGYSYRVLFSVGGWEGEVWFVRVDVDSDDFELMIPFNELDKRMKNLRERMY